MTPHRFPPTARAVALHGVALAILLWPLVGITFVPMVDLPGHLAITRVLDDVLHGKYHDVLQVNLDPVHKPTYALLYAVFSVLPKSMVGPVAAGLLVASCYAAVCHCIASLGRRPASSPLVVSLALLVGMFIFSSMFFWGLIPFILSIPPALIAYRAYLQASGVVDGPDAGPRPKARALTFLAAAVLAHVVHPLSSFFLGIMLAGATVTAAAGALVRRNVDGAAAIAVAWPLAAWAAAVGTLHVLTAPAGHELDLAHSAPAFAAPFHGIAEARTLLAQMPIELGMLPIRERAPTFTAYPVTVALFLVASWTIALVARARHRRPPEPRSATAFARSPVVRLATVLVLSALLLLFLRHDMVRISGRLLWFPVRAPCFLVFFFATLAAALLLRLLEPIRPHRFVSAVLVAAAVAIASERSAVLRAHFVAFDAQVQAFFRGDITDRYFRSQPFSYADHIRVYNCYFDDTCRDLSTLFFSIYPDATIYPVSRIPPPSGDGAHTDDTHR